MRKVSITAALLVLASCGGGSDDGSPAPPPPALANRAPAFTSPAAASVPENAAGVAYQAAAADPDGQALTFAIAGGADAARFAITPAGALSFLAAPDFEAAADADRDNIYLVRLTVSDGAASATLDLAVTVTNVAGDGVAVARVASGLVQPLFVAPVPGSSRVFVLEKGGRVLLLDPATGATTTFMNVAGTISTGGERGLLGLAATPDYATSGVVILYVTNPAGDIEIRRYERFGNAEAADPARYFVMLTIPHRQFDNHNGGWLGFGPDGLLYIATGDSGGSGDPLGNAQNTNSLLGKILRIRYLPDPNAGATVNQTFYSIPAGNPFANGGPLANGGAREVFAYGLRNPFRAGFDGPDLLIGDVGQGAVEEVDRLAPADAGANYGWPFLEGTRPFRGTAPAGTRAPVTEYDHGTGPSQGRSVTGGYVYRGPAIALRGQYVFGDFVTGNIWSLPAADLVAGATVSSSRYARRNADFAPNAGAIGSVVSFGEDAQRNLFIVDFDGEIFMVRPSGWSPRLVAGDPPCVADARAPRRSLSKPDPSYAEGALRSAHLRARRPDRTRRLGASRNPECGHVVQAEPDEPRRRFRSNDA